MFKKLAVLGIAALLVAGGAVYHVAERQNDGVWVIKAA